jgi:hypothetical protein
MFWPDLLLDFQFECAVGVFVVAVVALKQPFGHLGHVRPDKALRAAKRNPTSETTVD